MARVILETPGEDVIVGGDDVEVIGTVSGGEYITVIEGDIELDASFNQGGDTISLPGEAEDYIATFQGSRIILTSVVNDVVISMPVPAPGDSYTLVFREDGDTRTVTSNTSGQAVIGEETFDQGESGQLDSNDEETLADALDSFQEAEQAIDDFEEQLDEDTDGEITSIDELNAAEEQCEEDLAAARAIASDDELEERRDLEQAELDSAQADVDAVEGLPEAIEAFEEAEADAADASDAETDADAELEAAVARYNVLNDPDVDLGEAYNGVNATRNPDGSIDYSGDITDMGANVLIVSEADGDLVLASGVTETTNPGVTELLNAVRDEARTDLENFEAQSDLQDASEELDLIDESPSGDAARADAEEFEEAVAEFNEELADYRAGATEANAAALEAAYAQLNAASEGTTAVADDTDLVPDGVQADEISADEAEIDAAIDEERDENRDAILLAEDGDNPLYEALLEEQAEFDDAQGDVDDRNELIAECEALDELAAEGAALEAARDAAAADAMAQGDFEEPEFVDGTEQATDGNDLFVAGDEDGENGTILDFGEEGNDLLYIGEEYTVVFLDDDTDVENENVGDDDVLEAFIVETDDGVMVFLEETAESGNVGDGDFFGPEILLDSLTMEDITVNEGFIMGA